MTKAHPLYGRCLIVNITAIIANHNTAAELTISVICQQLTAKYPDPKIDRKALNKRVRSSVNSLAQSKIITTEIRKTPDHKLPYIIIIP